MVANSQRNDIAPFRIDPWPEERWWLIFFVLFVAAGLFGWLQDCLTLSLLLAMTAYGVICWLKGRTANALLAATARAAEEDWRVLRGVTLEHATQISQSSNGGLLIRAATVLRYSFQGSGETDADAVVTAVLSGLSSRIRRMQTAAANGPRMGLAGTALGLWLLYAGIRITSDPNELSESVLQALVGLQFAVATTLAGILIEKLLSNQASAAETALAELHSQMVAQLHLLQFGRTNNA